VPRATPYSAMPSLRGGPESAIMFRRSVPKEAIRRLLGHHSWEFTASTIVHLDDDDDLPDGSIVGDLAAPLNRDGSPVTLASEARTGLLPDVGVRRVRTRLVR
jgi:hypothetical protein